MIWTVNPITNLDVLQNNIDEFLNQKFGYSNNCGTPFVNVYESDDSIKVIAELPGVKKEDVGVSIADDILTISGKKDDVDMTGKSIVRKERSSGKFEKTIQLPFKVNENGIKASLKDGLLTIELPKTEEVKPKKIQIN